MEYFREIAGYVWKYKGNCYLWNSPCKCLSFAGRCVKSAGYKIYDTIQDADGEHRVLNKKETMLAQQKQDMIKEAFKEWIFVI